MIAHGAASAVAAFTLCIPGPAPIGRRPLSGWSLWYVLSMDADISDELTSRMPIVPHNTAAGVDCCGCIIAAVDGTNVELRCNECGAVVGVVQVDILKGLLGAPPSRYHASYLRRLAGRDVDFGGSRTDPVIGRKGGAPGQLLDAARRREIDVVLVWRLDH
jgi:hypothetical protein